MNRNSLKAAAWILAAISLAGQARAAEENPVLLRFDTSVLSYAAHDGQVPTTNNFTPWGGKPLSADTVAEEITPTALPLVGGACKWLRTGGTNQAVAFEAAKAWPGARGAFSFWATGKNWDLHSPVRETLLVIEGDDDAVAVERSKPGMLSVASSKGPRLDVPFVGNPNAPHFVTVNFEPGQTTLFIDVVQVGVAGNIVWPTTPKRLVFGQLGPGPGPNKHLESLTTYKRPLTRGEMAMSYCEFNPILEHVVTIPRLSKGPVIDGVMDDAAWKNAAVLSGMVNDFEGDGWHSGPMGASAVEDRVYLAYDDKYLYVGYHNPAPKQIRGNPPMVAAMMKVSKTAFDTNVDADDSFFIRMRDPYPFGDDYRLIVNHGNTHYDYTVGGKKLKGININWNPAWITKSTLDMDGWHLECAIPLDGFEQMSPPKTGDLWHMTFSRIWKTTLEGATWWSAGLRDMSNGQAILYAGLGAVRFGGESPVVFRLMQMGDINAGQVDIQAELLNRSTMPRTVAVAITSNTGEINRRQNVALAAGERKPYAFRGRIVDFSTIRLRLEARVVGGEAIYVHEMPVVRSDKIDVYAFNYPSFGLVRYEVGCLALAKYKAEDIALSVSAKNAAGETLFAREFQGMPDYKRVVDIPMKDWKPGPHSVQFTFMHQGKALATEEAKYQKKPLPVWYGNKIGCDGLHPAPPWTDVQANENQVNVWGRQYEFGGSLMPERIVTQGRQLLRGPMTITGETAEKGPFTSAGAKADAKLVKKNNCRVEGRRRVSVPGLSLTNAWWAEYDGFCWVKLVLAPEQKANVKSLVLSIPFTKEFSDVMNCCDYSIRKNDVVPPQGVTHAPSLPIWVGNAVGGLQFFVDTTGPWSVKNEATSIRLENGPEGATLKVTMIDVPLAIAKPYPIEFAFTVTPVKDLRHRKIIQPWEGWARTWDYWWFPNGEWMPGHPGWAREGGGSASYVNLTDARPGWVHGGPYTNLNYVYCNTSDREGNEDVMEFGDEWSANAAARFRASGNLATSFHSPSFQDWVVWKYYQLFKKSPYRCMYHDVSHIVSNSNPFAQAGFVCADGTRVSSQGILGIRNVYKRFYNFIAYYYPEAVNSVFHSSGMPNMSYESFGGRFWTDENLNGRINEQQPTYRGLVTPAKFRAEYLGRNFGNYSAFIGQGRIRAETCWKYGIDAVWDHIKGLCLLHDMEKGAEAAPLDYRYDYNPKWSVYKAVRARDEQALIRHNIYSPAYDFVGYWDQKAATAPNANAYVSLYIRKDKEVKPYDCDGTTGPNVVFVVCNESDYRGEMRLPVDWKSLGFDPAKPFKAENLVHRVGLRVNDPDPQTDKIVLFKKPEETAAVQDGKLTFPMTEWNYRMISVSQ